MKNNSHINTNNIIRSREGAPPEEEDGTSQTIEDGRITINSITIRRLVTISIAEAAAIRAGIGETEGTGTIAAAVETSPHTTGIRIDITITTIVTITDAPFNNADRPAVRWGSLRQQPGPDAFVTEVVQSREGGGCCQ